MPPRPAPSVRLPRRQRGVALVSALIAFLVVAVGALAALRAQAHLRSGADSARQRIEATRLAQAEVERLRAFARLAGHDAIADGAFDVTPAGSGTAYALARTVVTQPGVELKSVQVEVSWRDRRGTVERVRLATLIARRDPALGGALTQPARGLPST